MQASTLLVDSIEIDPSGASTNQVLKFNGTKFIPGVISIYENTGGSYTEVFGDSINSSFLITHNLGTREVLVIVQNVNNYENVVVNWNATTLNAITLDLSQVVDLNSKKVIVLSAGTGFKHTQIIGDGTSTEIPVSHLLGSQEAYAVVRSTTAPYEIIECRFEPRSKKHGVLFFSSPPAVDSLSVSVFVPLQGFTYSVNVGNNVSNSFNITHNLNTKNINIVCRDTEYPYAYSEIQWEANSDNTAVVRFSAAPGVLSKRITVFSSIGSKYDLGNLSELNDITLTSVQNSETLIYNGSFWVNRQRISTVIPSSIYGQAGDKKGDTAIDATYLYICYSDYVNNSTRVWRRVQLDSSW